MARKSNVDLARRERQIMDVLFRLGEGTVADVRNLVTRTLQFTIQQEIHSMLRAISCTVVSLGDLCYFILRVHCDRQLSSVRLRTE